MGFSQHIDWQEELRENYEDWENLGRIAIEEQCNHYDKDTNSAPKYKDNNMRYQGYCEQCGHYEDSCEPMMNYGYPLDIELSEEAVLKIVEETNCTVMYSNRTDTHYIVLCGGGMDLSQDIALAFYYAQKWIPTDLALQTCTQPNLSQYGNNFRKVMRACRESLNKDKFQIQARIKEINGSIKKSLQLEREKKVSK